MKILLLYVLVITALGGCTPAPKQKLSFAPSEITVAHPSSTKLTMTIAPVDPKDVTPAHVHCYGQLPGGITVTPTDAVVTGSTLELTLTVSATANVRQTVLVFKPDPGGYGSAAELRVNIQ